jgi:hypothetical protein
LVAVAAVVFLTAFAAAGRASLTAFYFACRFFFFAASFFLVLSSCGLWH